MLRKTSTALSFLFLYLILDKSITMHFVEVIFWSRIWQQNQVYGLEYEKIIDRNPKQKMSSWNTYFMLESIPPIEACSYSIRNHV